MSEIPLSLTGNTESSIPGLTFEHDGADPQPSHGGNLDVFGLFTNAVTGILNSLDRREMTAAEQASTPVQVIVDGHIVAEGSLLELPRQIEGEWGKITTAGTFVPFGEPVPIEVKTDSKDQPLSL